MAHYESVKSYYFGKSAKVPYRYVCGKCGKEVTGKAEIATENKEVKVSSRNPNNLQVKPEDAAAADWKSLLELEALVSRRRSEVASGNYDLLNKYCKCPYCGAYQKWSFRPGRAITFSILTLGGVAVDILSLILYIKQVRSGETDKTFLLIFLFLWLYILAFGAIAVGEIKGLRTTGSQGALKPQVFFDKIDCPYLDANGKARTRDTVTTVDRSGHVTEIQRK
ncbi:MAG: hypothetical protein IJH91_03505 [Mogibacterium sp.]|nr:hypothetical protein [Mogibacterium sp.]